MYEEKQNKFNEHSNTNHMKRNLFTNFIICGAFGWCLECLFTGICSIFQGKDRKLSCNTSIWMFPIYGLAVLIKPVHAMLGKTNACIRGGIYVIGIFIAEFSLGSLLKKYKACPWDYSKAKYNYKGVIRFDYAPLWFFVGLTYEKILNLPNKKVRK